ncbi:class I SAM-dependent methyltransferase [Leptobacterium sp. I13]|uniref:class I SAM-dependent methyltransferase n=1 Tax=Leptobacterium meishanense TaxID=3128904 RepID=UPI0030ECB5DA
MTKQKEHWEAIYATKQPHEVSWTQKVPKTALAFIEKAKLPKTANIIDIGGGDSNFVDLLLQEGFENITVLDISEHALNRTKKRLGEKAKKVTWVVSDMVDFQPKTTYDFWHDRAAFHFLTTDEQIESYVSTAAQAIKKGGCLAIGTFSTEGPKKCSGLDIEQYNPEKLMRTFDKYFDKVQCITQDHLTPFGTTQNFLFCLLKRKGFLENLSP